MMSRNSLRPIGSKPENGSSRMRNSGSPMSAWASPILWVIPLENFLNSSPSFPSSPTRFNSFRVRSLISALEREKS